MSTSIGAQLRAARESQNLSLEDVARQIFIRERYLMAMEAGNFAAMPSRAQARGFLSLYADFLKLDTDALLSALDESFSPQDAPSPAPTVQQKTEAPLPSSTTNAFIEIGEVLQQRRSLLSLSLEEVEKRIHIRQRFLEAMEKGDFQQLPSSMQARGMLQLYAEFLDLDANDLLLKFAGALQSQLEEKQPATHRTPRPEKTSRPGWRFWSDWGIVFVIGVLLVTLIGWAVGQVADESTAPQTPVPSPPEIADVLLATPTPAATATNTPVPTEQGGVVIDTTPGGPLAPTPTATLNLPGAESGVNINIVVHQRAWLQVVVDGKTAFSGRVLPGSAYPFSANERIEVTTGNASALQIYYQGRDIGALGTPGEAIWRIFTTQGIATPTPQFTNTPTPTSSPTTTPPVTPTATP